MKLEDVKPKMLVELDCYDAHYRVRVAKNDQHGIFAEAFRVLADNESAQGEVNSGGLFRKSEITNIRRAKVKRL